MSGDTMWCITRGCYSDYSVLAVFGDKPTAEAWAAAMNGAKESYDDECQVEELTYVSAGTSPIKVTTYRRSVELWDDGTTQDHGLRSDTEWLIACLWGPPPSRPKVRFVRAPVHRDRGGRLDVTGDSAEAVEKVINDRLAMWKAGAWVTRNLGDWSNDSEETP